jgi:hypothetical protein
MRKLTERETIKTETKKIDLGEKRLKANVHTKWLKVSHLRSPYKRYLL